MQQFSNAALHATIAVQTLYTCAANEDAVIHNLLITNSHTLEIAISLELIKGVGAAFTFDLLPDGYILLPKSTLEMKPINLVSGDKIQISVTVDGVCDVFASILKEIRDF